MPNKRDSRVGLVLAKGQDVRRVTDVLYPWVDFRASGCDCRCTVEEWNSWAKDAERADPPRHLHGRGEGDRISRGGCRCRLTNRNRPR